jgi:indole-3-glycerol phosphate synthase
LIGFNHRDLKTMRVDFSFSKEVLQVSRPQGTVLVAESGITKASHLRELKKAGFDAFLVGSALMRAPDPGVALREWLEEAGQE